MKKSLLAKIIGSVLSTIAAGSVVFAVANNANDLKKLSPSKASAYSVALNSANSPVLSGGSATRVDDKNVTWEYYNASDYADGHVTLNSDSYFGISSSTDWGYTAIEGVTVNFSGDDLWLLKSVDGVTWHECETLTSDVTSHKADSWRYVRFYNYSDSVDINSVIIDYNCSGISATEDVDSAVIGNVIATDGLSYSRETTDLSPNSDGGEAVRFTKSGNRSTTLTIGFNESHTLKDVAYDKIEFDIWTTNVSYGKNIEVLNSDGSYTSSKLTAASGLHTANPTDSYVWTSLGNNWYHAELPITALVSLISGYGTKDLPSKTTLNKQFNAIRINAGNCVIDNLRIGSSACELGTYNSATYKPVVGEIFWVKTSWVGKLYAEDVEITFSDDTMARHIPLSDPNLKNGSPFYIELLGSGTFTVYVSIVCGYNHRTQTTSRTVTVK